MELGNEEVVQEKLHRRFFKEYKKKKEHVEAGFVNCIPFPFKRFRKELPGIEKAKNYIITANAKVNDVIYLSILFILLHIINFIYIFAVLM